MSKTKIAVIGLGGVAQLVHLPILTKLRDVEITAVAEPNKNRLNSVTSKFDIKHKFPDHKSLLENAQFDAAIIATPTNTHKSIALDFLGAGKNLLIEKPIATTLEDAKLIDDAAKKNNCKVVVGMNLRFRPDAMLLRSLVNSGELGDISYINCGWIRKQSSNQKWFVKKSHSGGGVMFDLGINLFDLSLWLLNFPEIQSVSVKKFNYNTKNVEDTSVGLIKTKNGAVINFDVSWSLHSESNGFNLSVFGTDGTATLNPLNAFRRIDSNRIELVPNSKSMKNLFKRSFENELKHFIGSINGNFPVISSSNDAVKRMKLMEALYKSAELNKEVEM